jgi:hypothetical protein
MLGRRSRILVLAAVVATAVLGVYVHHHQNAGAMGGRISLPKLAWLLYTVFVWGLLCPILAFEPGVRRPFRVVAGLFAALMIARFVAEIPMLYVWKNWRPPYGMVHDLVCVAALAWGLAASRAAWWPPRAAPTAGCWPSLATLALGASWSACMRVCSTARCTARPPGARGCGSRRPAIRASPLSTASRWSSTSSSTFSCWPSSRLASARGASPRRGPGVSAGRLRLSVPADNAALLDLFGSVPMEGNLVLSTRRDPDFFALYDIQRGIRECWVYENARGPAGLGTVLVREGWLDGRPCRVGYLGDLRSTISASRERGLVRVYGDTIADAGRRHGASTSSPPCSHPTPLRSMRWCAAARHAPPSRATGCSGASRWSRSSSCPRGPPAPAAGG